MSQKSSIITPKLNHPALQAVLKGYEAEIGETKIVHFRGIQYASIPKRFAEATLKEQWQGQELDCTKFGPQCPQNDVDVSYLLRIPKKFNSHQHVEQDELKCLNLNVSVPVTPSEKPLPVLIWIHGGSQVVSYPPASHICSDTSSLIARSTTQKGPKNERSPVITVTFNYRLNIFGFGDGSEKNLALKDQRLAIEWVVKHIAGFGGDKDNITLGGESAGAVYTHAHLCTGAPVRRGILQSGSLYLSPPLGYERGDGLISSISKNLKEKYQSSLIDAPVSEILQQLKDQNVNTLWIQEEPDLKDWKEKTNDVEELLIGDVEYESVIWRNGLENASAEEISAAFDSDAEYGQTLEHLYGISESQPTPSRIGALDFINDARFAMPVEEILKQRQVAGRTTYRYVFDQPNPWQSSSRAHHCVDLLYLFANEKLPFHVASAENVRDHIQSSWIAFINGNAPWSTSTREAFGPFGKCGPISEEEFASRRRVGHFEVLKKMEPGNLALIFGKLAAGRISLLN